MRIVIVIASLLFFPLLAVAHPSVNLLDSYQDLYVRLQSQALPSTAPEVQKLQKVVANVRRLQPDLPAGEVIVIGDNDAGIIGQAFPSGAVALHAELSKESEIVQLFIVAHEMGHVRQNIFGNFTRFLNLRVPANTQDADLMPLLSELSEDFFALSRQQEHDADAFAATLVRRAGYPLDDIITFFQHHPTVTSTTHPSHIDRIRNIERFQ